MQEVGPTVLQLVREALETKDRPWLEDQLAQYRLPRLRPFDARIARDIIANRKVRLFQFREEDLIRIPYCTTMDEVPTEEQDMKSEPRVLCFCDPPKYRRENCVCEICHEGFQDQIRIMCPVSGHFTTLEKSLHSCLNK
jgi:hypothetical protein